MSAARDHADQPPPTPTSAVPRPAGDTAATGEHSLAHSPVLKRIFGRFYFMNDFWFRLHYYGVKWRITVRPHCALWTLFFFFVLVRCRRGITRNLDTVLGPTGFFGRQLRGLRAFWAWTMCRTERYEQMLPKKPGVERTVVGEQHWRQLFDDERGFILVSAHIGLYEAGNMIPSEQVRRD